MILLIIITASLSIIGTLYSLFLIYSIKQRRKLLNELCEQTETLEGCIEVLEYKRSQVINLIGSVVQSTLPMYNRKVFLSTYQDDPAIFKEVQLYRDFLEDLNFKYFCLTGEDSIKFADSPKRGELIQNLN